MSRDPHLPDDLARLGVYLEAATVEAMRRRARRQTLMNFVGAVVLAVPFALAVAATDLSPGDAFAPPPAVISLALEPPTNAFMVRHIPDEPLPPSAKQECRTAHDCRGFVKPAPHIDTLGKR
ncbi:MAG: hypothetical protein ABI611_22355 [Solirubrobacteraceae bacterium]